MNEKEPEVKNISRRNFLRNSGVLAGSLALGGTTLLAGCATEKPAVQQPAKAKNRLCEVLGIEKPVISAPMYALTDAKFVAAVSEAGGLGMLGVKLVDPTTNNFPAESDAAAVVKLARDEIQKIKSLTKKPFGVNMPWWDVPGFQEMILEEKPAVIIPGLTNTKQLRDAGIKVVGYAPGGYSNGGENIQKIAANCDLMMVKAYGCGGHVPGPSRENALMLMEKYAGKVDVPLVPGGGITNAYGAAAMARSGAEGVWIGTSFLVTEEHPAHAKTKQAIIDQEASKMIEFKSSIGGWLHTSDTPKARKVLAMGLAGATQAELGAAYYGVYLAMRLGDLDDWFINVSDAVDSIKSMKTVKQVVDELGDAFLAAQP